MKAKMNYFKSEDENTEDEEIEETAEEVAKLVRKKLNLDSSKMPIVSKIFSEIDLERADRLTGDEKTIGFFKALWQDDKVALKALSEGIAVDGGYIVPDQIYEGVVRDLAEQGVLYNLVKKVPMKSDTMRIPKLVSHPKLRWTSENAAKSKLLLHLSAMVSRKLRKLQGTLKNFFKTICSQIPLMWERFNGHNRRVPLSAGLWNGLSFAVMQRLT